MARDLLLHRLRAVVLLMLLCLAVAAQAATIRWRTENFSYVAQNKPLKEFLREFAASQGLTTVIAPEVEGTISGRFNLTPSSMLDLLTTTYGLVWYFDGNVLFVYPASDITSQVIHLRNAQTPRLREALAKLDLADARYPIVYDARQNTAFVSGPKRYVELVVQTARAVDENDGAVQASDIRVFPLKYAWAADFVFTQGGREYTVPGVASVLSNLYGANNAYPNTANGLPQGAPSNRTRAAVRKLQGMGVLGRDALPNDATGPADTQRVQGTFMPRGQELPQFQPDGRMNAVVVRDVPERMAFYESVIRSLDVKPGLVEIEVRIIEVRSSELESLGIDWRAHSGHVDLQLGRGNIPPLDFGSALTTGSIPTTPVGGALTSVLGDAGRYLIARVNALAQDGKANILSSPRVLTLDNVEAVMENISTFFVRVAGNLDASLFDVSTGTSLRVTPLIVTEGDKRQVKLAVRIEDGSVDSQNTVDAIPVVHRSTIGTQAFVSEGESLLLGGHVFDSKTDQETGVPGLSKLPGIGALFRYREKNTERTERLFMITPRIVALP